MPDSPVNRPAPGVSSNHWKRSVNGVRAPSSHSSVVALPSGSWVSPKCCRYISVLLAVVVPIRQFQQIRTALGLAGGLFGTGLAPLAVEIGLGVQRGSFPEGMAL